MAWETPRTNWSPADGVRDEDFNRIEGNILELYMSDATRADRTIYVSTSGTDTSGDGTAALPYATINKALSVLPKNLNGKVVTINIGAGTYNEDVKVDSFSNGLVRFTGTGTATIKSLTVSGGSILYVTSIDISTTTTGNGITVTEGSVLIDLSSVTMSGASVGLNVTNCSKAHIGGNATITNCNTGISSANNSEVFVFQLAGSGSGSGMVASNGSVISYGYNSATVTNVIAATSTGGRINTGSQSGVGGGGVL